MSMSMNIKTNRIKVYFPHDEYVWISGEIIREVENDSYEIEIHDDGVPHHITRDMRIFNGQLDTLPMQNDNLRLQGVDDMCSLDFLHEASILHNLIARFKSKMPYTYCGNICIAVNPYQWLNGIYSDDLKAKHMTYMKHELVPHVYAVSSAAYKDLRDYSKNQSILVSGESGAGKTETVKILMSHIAYMSKYKMHYASLSFKNNLISKDNDIIEKVLESNPLLESFGNAKTIRNDNSSRFGKFIQLIFINNDIANINSSTSAPILAGSRCITYLLEKSRVITQNHVKERNYHIFYQMFSCSDNSKQQLFLQSPSGGKAVPSEFRYTCNGDVSETLIEGVTDSDRYLQTMRTLELLGVNEEDRFQIQSILVGILYLGQLHFLGDNDSSYIDPSPESSLIVSHCCRLLGLDAESFSDKLINRSINVVGQETTVVNLSRDQASDARDALAKDMYEKLFLWLVNVINTSTAVSAVSDNSNRNDSLSEMKSISLLDIFGFESFETNRFEQLNINYANEKLQQKFTQDVLVTVQEEYQSEGLRWELITYKDNAEVLEFLEGKNGVFATLNEECMVPQGSDMKYLAKLVKFYSNFSSEKGQNTVCFSRSARMSKEQFCIHHYAGIIIYEVSGFLERNKDTLPGELKTLMTVSSNSILNQFYQSTESLATSKKNDLLKIKSSYDNFGSISSSSSSSNIKPADSYLKSETVTMKFRTQLTNLMFTISQTTVQYVRCIKPNTQKSSSIFDRLMVVEQLRCAGMIEAIRISRAAYPYRLTHEDFMKKFGCLKFTDTVKLDVKKTVPSIHQSSRHLCLCILQNMIENKFSPDFSVPSSPTKAANLRLFEIGKTKAFFSKGILEQLEIIRSKFLISHSITIQRYYRRFVAYKRYQRQKLAAVFLQSHFRVLLCLMWFRKQMAYVLSIQCCYRMRLARKVLVHKRRLKAAVHLQSWIRMNSMQSRYRITLKKIVNLQAWWRKCRAVTAYKIQLEKIRRQADLLYQIELLQQQLEEERQKQEIMKRSWEVEVQQLKHELMDVKVQRQADSLQYLNHLNESRTLDNSSITSMAVPFPEVAVIRSLDKTQDPTDSRMNTVNVHEDMTKPIADTIDEHLNNNVEQEAAQVNVHDSTEANNLSLLTEAVTYCDNLTHQEIVVDKNNSHILDVEMSAEVIVNDLPIESQLHEIAMESYPNCVDSSSLTVKTDDDVNAMTSHETEESTSPFPCSDLTLTPIDKEDSDRASLEQEIVRLQNKVHYLEHENTACKQVLLEHSNLSHTDSTETLRNDYMQLQALTIEQQSEISQHQHEKSIMLQTWDSLCNDIDDANAQRDDLIRSLALEKELRSRQTHLTMVFLSSSGLSSHLVTVLKRLIASLDQDSYSDFDGLDFGNEADCDIVSDIHSDAAEVDKYVEDRLDNFIDSLTDSVESHRKLASSPASSDIGLGSLTSVKSSDSISDGEHSKGKRLSMLNMRKSLEVPDYDSDKSSDKIFRRTARRRPIPSLLDSYPSKPEDKFCRSASPISCSRQPTSTLSPLPIVTRNIDSSVLIQENHFPCTTPPFRNHPWLKTQASKSDAEVSLEDKGLVGHVTATENNRQLDRRESPSTAVSKKTCVVWIPSFF